MKKGITKISFLLWVLAISGFIGSMMHYHIDSLHCLEHGDELHYSENELLCPVVVIQSTQPNLNITIPETLLVQEEIEFYYYAFFYEEIHGHFKSKRAPPFMI